MKNSGNKSNLSCALFDTVVDGGYCIGCGMCAGVCPQKNISIKMEANGIYGAVLQRDCYQENCNLCATSCPFWNQEANETSIAESLYSPQKNHEFNDLFGFSIGTFNGYSQKPAQRESGSSGGLASWLLEKLLTEKLVDYVVCVAPEYDADVFFNFQIISTVEELHECSKSCYYPVQTADCVQHILENEGRYAVTGIPCFIKAFRLASMRNAKLKKRVKYLLGLACGQYENRYFVDYLYAMIGGDPAYLSQVRFREKDERGSSLNYKFAFYSKSEEKPKFLYHQDGIGKTWARGYFRPDACNYCDDVFAETADVVFMDAWLPEHMDDPKGTNLILVRNHEILDVLMMVLPLEIFI